MTADRGAMGLIGTNESWVEARFLMEKAASCVLV